MRRIVTSEEARREGHTRTEIRRNLRSGSWQSVGRGVYLVTDGDSSPPTPVEDALAFVAATNGVASGTLAGLLYGLDSVDLEEPYVTLPEDARCRRGAVRRRELREEDVVFVDGYPCTNGLLTLVDLASTLDDLQWEQALESALRKSLLRVEELGDVHDQRGVARIRRVLGLRPPGAAPTESLLETLAVQMIRSEPRVPQPTRQVEVRNRYGEFAGRVDLGWPEHGVFMELDGQQHEGQPVYDSSRQTRIVAITGWLPARFTWAEIKFNPRYSQRRLAQLFETAADRK